MKIFLICCFTFLSLCGSNILADKLDWYNRVTENSDGWEEAWHVHELTDVDPLDPQNRIGFIRGQLTQDTRDSICVLVLL